jgi:hypothetical protein
MTVDEGNSDQTSWQKAKIERFKYYRTRCNLCGREHDKKSHAHFFSYNGEELQCCIACKSNAPSEILRREYWDRTYSEPDANNPLWRYVDLGKFLDALLFKRLWFAQVGNLDDNFEGALGSKARQTNWRKWMHDFLLSAIKNPPAPRAQEISEEEALSQADRLLSDTEAALSRQRTETYINCWHTAKHESFLMWKVYAKDRPDSVCIKTNLIRIRKSLGTEYRVGLVNYINFQNSFPDVNWPFLYKRAAFLQESETRIFIRHIRDNLPGFYVPIDPTILIEEVIISPEAPSWVIDNIKRMIELAGLNIPCQISDLNEEPF